jgi:hypothetical protein
MVGDRVQVKKRYSGQDETCFYGKVTYIEYVPTLKCLPNGEKSECVYVRFDNPEAYSLWLLKGSQLISIRKKGAYDKCVIRKSQFSENAITEMTVCSEECALSPVNSASFDYKISLNEIDSMLICLSGYNIVKINM